MTTPPDGIAPLQLFVAELRALRQAAGSPSFRNMARRAHFSSSTLAEAVQGRRLPSQPVVEAFVKACGADPNTWTARWREVAEVLAAENQPTAAASDSAIPHPMDITSSATDRPTRQPADTDIPALAGSPPTRGGALPARNLRALRLLMAAGTLTLAATAGAIGTWAAASPAHVQITSASQHPATTVLPTPTTVPHDGADPADADCAVDANVSARTPLAISGHEVGALELRYSPSCQAGWARFYLVPGGVPALVEVRVEAQDGRASAYAQVATVDLPVYTDLLHPKGGCLRAIAAMQVRQQLYTATTNCLKIHN